MPNDGADFQTDLPDPATLSETELVVQIDERRAILTSIDQQLRAEGTGFTDRGRHWRARATTARAAIEGQIKILHRELGRRQFERRSARRERQLRYQETIAIGRAAKITQTDAVRFQAAAKAMLPREQYRAILDRSRQTTPPPEPEAAAPAESAPP